MPLIVHHLGHSQSDRVVWLCEELGLDYELKKYDRSPMLSPPAYLALHPIGAAPVIEDTEKGVKIAESAACMEYVLPLAGAHRRKEDRCWSVHGVRFHGDGRLDHPG